MQNFFQITLHSALYTLHCILSFVLCQYHLGSGRLAIPENGNGHCVPYLVGKHRVLKTFKIRDPAVVDAEQDVALLHAAVFCGAAGFHIGDVKTCGHPIIMLIEHGQIFTHDPQGGPSGYITLVDQLIHDFLDGGAGMRCRQ